MSRIRFLPHIHWKCRPPGEDRVLRTRAHFDRFAGSRVFVELKVPREGRKRYSGNAAVGDRQRH